MDDKALKSAEAKRAELAQAIARQRNDINDAMSKLNSLQQDAAELDAWIDMWHHLAGTKRATTTLERNEIGMPLVKAEKPKRPKNPDRELVVDEALAAIRVKGEPMNRKELFDALAGNGIIIHGKDPEMVLSTMLWRSQDRIERLVPFGYWPVGVEYPPATELKLKLEAAAESLAPPPR
jgi:hypothetical protein